MQQIRRLLSLTLLTASLTVWSHAVVAMVPPVVTEPLRIWVGYGNNSPAATVARQIAERLELQLGVPVIVENRPGAGGRLAAQGVAEASSTDNVLLLASPTTIVIAPAIFKRLGYNPYLDLIPISLAVYYEFGLAASPGANLAAAGALPDWVRANPLAFNIGVPGAGTLPYFFAVRIDRLVPDHAEFINYRGSGHMLADLMTDRLPLAIDTLDALTPAYRAGRAQILATSGLQRHPDFPEIPTFQEAGLDVQAEGWYAFFAPARMPVGTRRELGERLAQVLRDPGLRDELERLGFTPAGLDPTDTVAVVEESRALWRPLIEASGFQVGK